MTIVIMKRKKKRRQKLAAKRDRLEMKELGQAVAGKHFISPFNYIHVLLIQITTTTTTTTTTLYLNATKDVLAVMHPLGSVTSRCFG